MKIKNWRVYQHYKDRNPPWIKLHFALLSSPDWVTLDDASRVLAVACMLIASRDEGQIPNDPDYLRRVAYLNSPPDFRPLIRCGFLELDEDASKVLADASALQADARPETETEKKAEAEAEADPLPSLSSGLSDPTKDIGLAGSTEPPLVLKGTTTPKPKKPQPAADAWKKLKTRESQRNYWRTRPEIETLLQVWQDAWRLPRVPRPTDERLDKLHDAMLLGYPLRDLCLSVLGSTLDDWRRDAGGRAKELAVLLRPANIESNLLLATTGNDNPTVAQELALRLPPELDLSEVTTLKAARAKSLLRRFLRLPVENPELRAVIAALDSGTLTGGAYLNLLGHALAVYQGLLPADGLRDALQKAHDPGPPPDCLDDTARDWLTSLAADVAAAQIRAGADAAELAVQP